MAKAKKQVKTTGNDQLASVKELRAEIAKLSMEHAKRQLKQTTLLRTKKDELARALTRLNMVKLTDQNKEETK